jgi:hypothetical protein
VIISATPKVAPPFAGAGSAALAPGWSGYVVTLGTTTAGEKISAFDFSINNGIFGPLHQRWTDPDAGQAYVPTVGGTSRNNVDSHFLVTADWVIPPGVAQEDNPGTNSPAVSTDSDKFGRGTFMKSAAGIAGPAQAATLDVAYVVLPNGQSGTLTGLVSTSAGTFPVSGPIPIPEPTTAALMGLGALGMAARRRRA